MLSNKPIGIRDAEAVYIFFVGKAGNIPDLSTQKFLNFCCKKNRKDYEGQSKKNKNINFINSVSIGFY
jgi:hypothetical protein